jgi:hypothetical protein
MTQVVEVNAGQASPGNGGQPRAAVEVAMPQRRAHRAGEHERLIVVGVEALKGAPSARQGLTAPAVNSEDGREQPRERAAKATRRRRPGFTLDSPLRGGSFRRVLRTHALRRGGFRARHPGDRQPAVPAVSRCRARQHHGQADDHAPGAPGAVKMSLPTGRNGSRSGYESKSGRYHSLTRKRSLVQTQYGPPGQRP